jgi:hypothetical protein
MYTFYHVALKDVTNLGTAADYGRAAPVPEHRDTVSPEGAPFVAAATEWHLIRVSVLRRVRTALANVLTALWRLSPKPRQPALSRWAVYRDEFFRINGAEAGI